MGQDRKDPSSHSITSSLQILQSAQQGDSAALDRLMGLHRPHLLRWAHGQLPRKARAFIETEDLVQDALPRSVQAVPHFRYRGPGAFLAYLRQALRNRICDEMRKVSRGPLAQTFEEKAAHAPSPLDLVMGSETLQLYEKALEKLNDQEREAVVARIELGMAYAEIAQSVGKPSADAARMTVSRALVKLVRKMSHAGFAG